MNFVEVMKTTLFRNQDRFNGGQPIERGKPNFGNTKITLHEAIPPGDYTISGWQYLDTMNIAISMSRVEKELDPQPQQLNQSTDGFDDFR